MKKEKIILGLLLWSATGQIAKGDMEVSERFPAANAALLSLEGYLDQVEAKNAGVQGATLSSQGALLRSKEGGLLTSPQLFSQVQYASDKKPSLSGVSYDEAHKTDWSVGLAENFSFGLGAKASYNVSHTSFDNFSNPLGAFLTGDAKTQSSWANYNEVTPRLELTFPLWGGGFGRTIRANRDAITFGAKAQSFGSRFQGQTAMVAAEGAYWKLALAREVLRTQKEALERSQKIMNLRERQAKVNLADQSDALQAKAGYELRYLDYQAAIEEERAAAQNFNLTRGVEGSVVKERLRDPDVNALISTSPPRRDSGSDRSDVRAAEFQALATQADHQAQMEKSKPTLDVYGSYQLYGKAQPFPQANTDAWTAGRDNKITDTRVIGVKFSVPVDYFSASKAQQGRAKEQMGADLQYQQKVRDQESQWNDLSRKFLDIRSRLKLLLALEKTQEAKLTRERTRLNAGRSTTFQILSFEQDYAQAQLLRIKVEGEALAILAQMKLFFGNEDKNL